MKFKEILQRQKTTQVNKINISTEEHELDVPKVSFEDFELQVMIGQWLGILSSQQGFGNSEFTIYTHLSAKELMKKINISTEELEKIATKFGLLLKLTGVDTAETCILNQFDKDKFSFNCHFNNRGKDANISLRWGDWMDEGPEFIIDYENERKSYEYSEKFEKRPTRLKLQHYTVKNSENGNSYYRYLSPYRVSINLSNDEYIFSIDIQKPESIKDYVLGDYIFRLQNEEQLQQYLLGLTFPFEINKIYKKICEISANSKDEYPNFNLKVERKVDKETNKTTDMISLKQGKLTNFI